MTMGDRGADLGGDVAGRAGEGISPHGGLTLHQIAEAIVIKILEYW